MNSPAKTRILFVDDEPIILELIKISLSTMADKWDTLQAGSAEEALKLLEQEPVDVVVSDMGLPGMTGAQLLNEIMQRYPATIRIILSGFADKEQVMRCAGATHQFLSKPFSLTELKATLRRIQGLKHRLASLEIRQLVAGKEHLPSIPAVYFKILEALQQPDCPVEQIGRVVATDPGLMSKLLQLVNSAFLGFGRQVSSADEAILLLGVGTIRSLALTLHLFSAFNSSQPENRALEQVWGHSVRVGRFAQRIIKLEGGDEKAAEEAFTAGLLHDIGKLALADNPSLKYLDLMTQARETNRQLVEVEREKYQATHAEAGAYLLDLWGLPAPLVEAVAWHHEPAKTAEPEFGSLTAVHAANALEPQLTEGSPCQGLDSDYLARLSLTERLGVWRADLLDSAS